MISYQNKADFIHNPTIIQYTTYPFCIFTRTLHYHDHDHNTLEYIKSYDKSRSVLVVTGITNYHTN